MVIRTWIGWRLGFSGTPLVSINEVTLRWAQLVLGWVTVGGRVTG